MTTQNKSLTLSLVEVMLLRTSMGLWSIFISIHNHGAWSYGEWKYKKEGVKCLKRVKELFAADCRSSLVNPGNVVAMFSSAIARARKEHPDTFVCRRVVTKGGG